MPPAMARVKFLVCLLVSIFCASYGETGENDTFHEHKNRSSALEHFGMVLKTEGVPSFRDEDIVFTKGILAEQWKSDCRESPKTTDGDKACVIRSFNAYQDQVTFEFLYHNASLYTFKRPTVSAVGGRAQPKVHDFSNDEDERTGEITVRHGCSSVSSGTVAISSIVLTFDLDDKTNISLTWDKKCGFGKHEKLDYGWFAGNGGDLSKPVSLSDAVLDEEPVFGPRSLSTRIYMTLEEDAHSQYYDAPMVESRKVSGAEAVGVELRGSNYGGVVVATAYSVFDIMYTCHSKGVSVVNATVGVPPFSPIRMRWRKDCGGGVALRVKVGTTAPAWGYASSADVVSGGVALGPFTESGELGKAGSTLVRHKTRLGNRFFYVWATGGGSAEMGDEEIGEVSAHALDERVVTAGVKMWKEGRGIIGKARPLAVWTKCKKRGKTRVRVTMTVRDRDAVEWWFDDVCTRERLRTRKAGLRLTAGSVMYMTLGMFAVVMGVWMKKMWVGVDKRGMEPVLRHEWRNV